MTAHRYRSRPQEVEAIRWTGENVWEVEEFVGSTSVFVDRASVLHLRAGKDGSQGYVPVPVGHWIVRSAGDMSDHWPVEDDYFTAKYEAATDDGDSDGA